MSSTLYSTFPVHSIWLCRKLCNLAIPNELKIFPQTILQVKNADHFSQYVTEDFDEYIKRKRVNSCHGNNIEMQALSEMYNRTIEVYKYSLGNCYK